VVVTKFGGPPGRVGGGVRAAIMASVEGSLRRLGTGHIDVYLMHFPDPSTPIESTLSTLHELVEAGSVRAIGCSNFSTAQVVEASETANSLGVTPMVGLENEFSLLERTDQQNWLELCATYGLGILPYRPLGRGLLTGKYRADERPPYNTRLGRDKALAQRLLTAATFEIVGSLREFAESRGRTLAELAFGWLLSHPAVASVIAGATSAAQVRDNAESATWRLDGLDRAEVNRIVAESATDEAAGSA
jgi:aryl-alcohol dehydrogenase-like predicted oxidoreductase